MSCRTHEYREGGVIERERRERSVALFDSVSDTDTILDSAAAATGVTVTVLRYRRQLTAVRLFSLPRKFARLKVVFETLR